MGVGLGRAGERDLDAWHAHVRRLDVREFEVAQLGANLLLGAGSASVVWGGVGRVRVSGKGHGREGHGQWSVLSAQCSVVSGQGSVVRVRARVSGERGGGVERTSPSGRATTTIFATC